MYTEWTHHLADPKEKADWENEVKGSRRVLDFIKDKLLKREATLDRFTRDPAAYDTANWAYKRSNIDGRYSELKYLLTLIDLDQQK